MYENEFTTKEELARELELITRTNRIPSDIFCTFSFARYGKGTNTYVGTPLETVINQIMSYEEMLPEGERYKGKIFYYYN
jgi:hypothetical protein